MPRYLFACNDCGEEREIWLAVKDLPDARCDLCESMDLRRIWTPPATKRDVNDTSKMEPAEREMHLANKRYYESRAQDIFDGKLSLKMKGAEEFRPQIDRIYDDMKSGRIRPSTKKGDDSVI